ncbi:MAG: hypothetical protein Q4P20_12325 [Eubacteriales bacterium]|nr:hypothetical protein [Eubacteriales bacterium]
MIIDKHRFVTKELTAWDYVITLGSKWNKMPRGEIDHRLHSQESRMILERMGIKSGWEDKLYTLSMLDYYKLAVYRAWFTKSRIIVLDRITEILRGQDLGEFMDCAQFLQEQGTAIFLLDMDEDFIYQYANRVDIMKNRRICYRLYPEEYDERLYEILGWERRSGISERNHVISKENGNIILRVSDLQFEEMLPLSFKVRSGEIAFLRDENYNTVSRIRDCLLGEKGWQSGFFWLGGKYYESNELPKLLGKEIGIQTEMPDKKSGVLFDNLTALDNLTTCLLPKARMHFIRKNIVDNIFDKATTWFEREELLKPLSEWSLPERLRLSYYKWYLLNPHLLVCLFPFAGQEPSYHEMIIQMLVTCAQRGMGIWIISSGIDAICEKTENMDFLQRLKYLDE